MNENDNGAPAGQQDLHSAIMNLPCKPGRAIAMYAASLQAYKEGHRDARHAAAELVNATAATAEQSSTAGAATERQIIEAASEIAGVAGAWDPFQNKFRRWLDPAKFFLGEAWTPTPEQLEAGRCRAQGGNTCDKSGSESAPAAAQGVDTAELLRKAADWANARGTHCDTVAKQKFENSITTYGAQQREAGRLEERREFKNFHRSLCERFGYTHDKRDWKRDQVSLEEHIAALSRQPAGEGLTKAADFIDAKAQAYLDENASNEPDTGAVAFRYGEAGRDYYNTLVELAEEVRALSAPVAAVPVGKREPDALMTTDRKGLFFPWFFVTGIPKDGLIPLFTAPELQEWFWRDGAPEHPWDKEWFIAETIHGDRVALRPLEEGGSYDYTTADHTHMKRAIIKRWAQFPDSEYVEAPRAAVPSSKVGEDDKRIDAQRLRNVAKLVGLESAVPQDDATLDGARSAVLGQIAAAQVVAMTECGAICHSVMDDPSVKREDEGVEIQRRILALIYSATPAQTQVEQKP